MPDELTSVCGIRDFIGFLEKCLRKKVVAYSWKSLTNPGENFGSELQSLEVKVTETYGSQIETLHLVAKTPVVAPFMIEVFQPSFTFVKETRFYSDVIPALEYFQRISNMPEPEKIDIFIACVGSRISLNPKSEVADADALLLLENIKVEHFENGNRLVGFNTDEAMAVMKALAKFHALCIGIRRLKPYLFNSKILPFCGAVNLILDDKDTRMLDSVCSDLNHVDSVDVDLIDVIKRQLKICFDFARDTNRAADTPYTTVVHRDLWINNVMIKRDSSDPNAPLKVKLYDFQLYFYQSFVSDLIFFLFTSVRLTDLVTNFKSLIDCYYAEFIKTLGLVHCPLDDYSFEKMWVEIQDRAKIELLHVLFMVKVSNFLPDQLPSDDISPDTFYKSEKPSQVVLNRWKKIIDIFRENDFIHKDQETVNVARRRWLQLINQ